jgi:acetoacetyl-CoA synthetase
LRAKTDEEALWTPSPDRVGGSNIDRFRRRVELEAGLELADTAQLHRWSIENLGSFWSAVWDDVGVIGEKGTETFVPGGQMWEARFFPQARLSVAENLLDGRGAAPDRMALLYRREDGLSRSLSWDQLRREVAAFASALLAAGVGEGDRVAAWMPHLPETVIGFLAANSIGAVFTSTSADFGVTGVVDRFGQVEPKVLLAADGYLYGGRTYPRLEELARIRQLLPSLELVVVVGSLDPSPDLSRIEGAVSYPEFVAGPGAASPSYRRFGFDHPLYILYSSGTTGRPKCIIHRAGGVLLKHLQEQQHHCDLKPGDHLFYFTTCGWMMWNWLVSGLATGACLVLFDGNPFHPGPSALFDLVDETAITLMGVSAKYIGSVMKSGLRPRQSHRLDSLRTITSTGSPLSVEGFRFVYESVKTDVHLASISGGTDLCGCFVGGDPTRAVYPGEIQGAALGMAMGIFNEAGQAVVGRPGELVCTEPFPSMPIRFWGEDGNALYRRAYFERFPGVWTHGDFALVTERGSYVILGRSDATLNAGGVRIGTAEIYRVVESFPEIVEAVAVGQQFDDDTRIVLFLRMGPGTRLTPELEAAIKQRLRSEESPRHVPALVVEVDDIPRTRSGKITEMAVTAAVNGDPIDNIEALANPEALEQFRRLVSSGHD